MIKRVKNTMVKLEWIIALIKELHATLFLYPVYDFHDAESVDAVINMDFTV